MARNRFYLPDATRFSRRWWLGRAKTLFWVAVITVLVWVYADMEFAIDVERVITLRLHTGMSKDVVLYPRRDVRLNVKVLGNQRSLDALQEFLARSGAVVSYDPSDRYMPGDHEIRTADVINRLAGVAQSGVTIQSVTPSHIDVRLVRAVRREVPVKAQVTGATADLLVEPERVTVRAAQSAWSEILRKLGADGAPLVLATRPIDLKLHPPGEPFEARLAETIADEPVEADPPTVRITVSRRQLTKFADIPVSVQVMTPWTWGEDDTWPKYRLVGKESSEWRREIRVTGPVEHVRLLEDENRRAELVTAYLVLREDDKRPIETWIEREVLVVFSQELKVKLDGEPPRVSFRLEERATAPAP